MATREQAAIESLLCHPEKVSRIPVGNPQEAIKVSLERWESLVEQSPGDTGTLIHLSGSCLG